MRLNNKVAVVTGAGSGIGRAAAVLLAKHGAKVGVLDQTPEDLQAVVDELRQRGHEALALPADVSKPEDLRRAVQTVIDRWCHLEIVVANAGINGVWAPLEELAPEEWDRTICVNLTGTFLTVKYAAPYLKMQGGSVIIVSSVNGTRIFSNTGASAYSSSKAGQVAFAKMVALELAKFGVRVNVICPGAIKTNISRSTEHRDLDEVKPKVEYPEGEIPLTGGEPGRPEQVAQLIAFLASDDSRLISGTEIFIDGTESLLVG